MTFLEALQKAARMDVDDIRIYREDGPSFSLNHLRQISLTDDCLYLGDILDFSDWQVETA